MMEDPTKPVAIATGPLRGVRILDLTSVVNGAYATQILADQGAEVIKLEDPGSGRSGGGDIMRRAGAPPGGQPDDLGPIFLTLNRNKRSIVLDLKRKGGRCAIGKLIESCDVFVASVRYDALARLGLSYEEVAAIRPNIIYAHAAGFGSEGPYAGQPAYDDLIQAASGMADILPRTYGGEPRLLPTQAADKISGLFMAQAIAAALFHRSRTGEGQFVEVPMLECVTSFLMVEHYFGHVYEPPSAPYGYPRVINPNRKPFPTKDGHIGLLPYTDKQWDQFFEIAGFGKAVSGDPRFATFTARNANIRELYALVEEAAATKTTQEWLDALQPLSVPVIKLNRLEDLETDPHLAAVDLFERRHHPHAGAYKLVRPPVKFSKSPSNFRRHAPRLGEQTSEILGEVGLSLADIKTASEEPKG
jgi:crotonobetainyl-CoA:carnitine CoA-transferase CaiB-like acyl-CoA transferase